MAPTQIIDGTFKFTAFADHFSGADSDKPELESDTAFECGRGKVKLVFELIEGKLDGRVYRVDDGQFPLKSKFKLTVGTASSVVPEVTYFPHWCKSAWKIGSETMNRDLLCTSKWGWNDFPIPLPTLLEAAAQAAGVLEVQVQATCTLQLPSKLTDHESCLRGNLQTLSADLAGSPTVRLLGPDDLRLELPKALICAHSGVLRAALESPMQEGQSLSINVVEVKRQALQDFALCLCSGGLPSVVVETWQRLLDLLLVADKYDVQELVDACVSLLSLAVSVKTVAPLMKVADQAGLTRLLRCLLYFCLGCSGRMMAVIDSDEYTEFSADLLRTIAAHQEVMGSDRLSKYPEFFQYLTVHREFDDTTDWSTLSTSQLRRACFERDLAASGTPAEVVTRLSWATSSSSSEPEPKRQRCE